MWWAIRTAIALQGSVYKTKGRAYLDSKVLLILQLSYYPQSIPFITNIMRVLLTGGSGFIAAHCIDILLQHGHSVVTTVRSQEKANKIKEAHSDVGKDKLDFAIVEDIAQPNAFDEAVKSDPPFEAVLHTASPFHFKATDIQKELIDPAVIGTTGILKSIKKSAPTVKRVVITSSFAATSMLPRVTGQTTHTPRRTGTLSLRSKHSRTLDSATVQARPLPRRLLGILSRRRSQTSASLPSTHLWSLAQLYVTTCARLHAQMLTFY